MNDYLNDNLRLYSILRNQYISQRFQVAPFLSWGHERCFVAMPSACDRGHNAKRPGKEQKLQRDVKKIRHIRRLDYASAAPLVATLRLQLGF